MWNEWVPSANIFLHSTIQHDVVSTTIVARIIQHAQLLLFEVHREQRVFYTNPRQAHFPSTHKQPQHVCARNLFLYQSRLLKFIWKIFYCCLSSRLLPLNGKHFSSGITHCARSTIHFIDVCFSGWKRREEKKILNLTKQQKILIV